MKFQHLSIYVKDLEESIDFYETIVGLRVLRRFEQGPAKLAFLTYKLGDTEIELIEFPEREFSGRGFFLCFKCHELEEMRDLAIARGWNPSEIQTPGNGDYFYVSDPNGVTVQLRDL